MNQVSRILMICLYASGLCQAQVIRGPFAQRLEQAQTEAQGLYDKHEYSQAAAVLEKLNADPAIALLPEWPDTLYDLACDQSLAGQTEQAQATLQQAVELGAAVSADQLAQDPDLVSLHNQPAFHQLVETLRKQEAPWKESAALATPYRTVLTEDEKVAGLSKFWSEARFNFPFFYRLSGMDWDALYMAYLPKVRDAKTTVDYYRVMMRLAVELKDGHTNVYPPPQLLNSLYAVPGLRTSLVEGSVVVTQVLDPNLRADGWKVGDVILKVGDLNIHEYAETKVAPYVSSSTSQDHDVRTFNYFLFSGDVNDPLVLTVEDAAGGRQVRTVKRLSTDVVGPMFKVVGSGFKLLAGKIAYVAVNEFEDDSGVKTILAHLPEIKVAKGIILDLRHNGGGNSQNGVSILQILASSSFQWENERTPDYKAVYRAWGLSQRPAALPQPLFLPDLQHHLSMPVVVLTSGETFSAAEDFVALFNSMHRGLVIGELTAGSTGQPFSFKLPGGGSARICTKDKAFIFENVKGLRYPSFYNYFCYIILQLRFPNVQRRKGEKWKEHRVRLERLATSGKCTTAQYNVIWQVLNAADYGVGQRRERVFIVGMRTELEIPYSFPLATHTREALLVDQWVTGKYWKRHGIPKRDIPHCPKSLKNTVSKLSTEQSTSPWRTVRDVIRSRVGTA